MRISLLYSWFLAQKKSHCSGNKNGWWQSHCQNKIHLWWEWSVLQDIPLLSFRLPVHRLIVLLCNLFSFILYSPFWYGNSRFVFIVMFVYGTYDENDLFFEYLPIKFQADYEFILDEDGMHYHFTLNGCFLMIAEDLNFVCTISKPCNITAYSRCDNRKISPCFHFDYRCTV